MGKRASTSSDPSLNPKKSPKKSKTSNVESFKSDMEKAEGSKKSPIPNSFPPIPISTNLIAANPLSSKFPAAAKKANIVDEDSISILERIIEFMSNNDGKIPTQSTMNLLFCSINNFLTTKVTSSHQLYNKMRNLKRKYFKLIESRVDTRSPELSTFFDLCTKIWGQANGKKVKSVEDETSKEKKTKKLKVEESHDEGDDNSENENNYDDDGDFEVDRAMFPIMFEQAKKLWQEKGFLMDDVDNVFKFIDKSSCEKFEKKWKQLVVKDVELEINQLKIDKEIRSMVQKMIR